MTFCTRASEDRPNKNLEEQRVKQSIRRTCAGVRQLLLVPVLSLRILSYSLRFLCVPLRLCGRSSCLNLVGALTAEPPCLSDDKQITR